MKSPAVKGDEKIGKALGRVPSGVFIVTAENGSEQVGMLASWIMQASFEPPALSIAIHPDRELYKVIRETGRCTVNVISKSNHNLMKTFSKYSPDQFKQVEHVSTYCGLKLKDAVAAMDCTVKDCVEAGDHHVFIVEVVDAELFHEENDPMTHLRKSGFSY